MLEFHIKVGKSGVLLWSGRAMGLVAQGMLFGRFQMIDSKDNYEEWSFND